MKEGGEGGEDGEKGGNDEDEDDDKKEVEFTDEKKLDELPAFQRLKILAKKVKDGAYEGDEDGEGEEGVEDGVEEDGDNDVFGSDKKINKCERKKEECVSTEKTE